MIDPKDYCRVSAPELDKYIQMLGKNNYKHLNLMIEKILIKIRNRHGKDGVKAIDLFNILINGMAMSTINMLNSFKNFHNQETKQEICMHNLVSLYAECLLSVVQEEKQNNKKQKMN